MHSSSGMTSFLTWLHNGQVIRVSALALDGQIVVLPDVYCISVVPLGYSRQAIKTKELEPTKEKELEPAKDNLR